MDNNRSIRGQNLIATLDLEGVAILVRPMDTVPAVEDGHIAADNAGRRHMWLWKQRGKRKDRQQQYGDAGACKRNELPRRPILQPLAEAFDQAKASFRTRQRHRRRQFSRRRMHTPHFVQDELSQSLVKTGRRLRCVKISVEDGLDVFVVEVIHQASQVTHVRNPLLPWHHAVAAETGSTATLCLCTNDRSPGQSHRRSNPRDIGE